MGKVRFSSFVVNLVALSLPMLVFFRLLRRRYQDEFSSCSSGGCNLEELASCLVAMFVDSEIKPSSQRFN